MILLEQFLRTDSSGLVIRTCYLRNDGTYIILFTCLQASIDRHLLPDPAQYPVRPPQGAPAAAASSATPLRRLVPANMPTATFSNRLTANFKLVSTCNVTPNKIL